MSSWQSKAEVRGSVLPSRATFYTVPWIRINIKRDMTKESYKYLGKSCYHCIKYTTVNSLAALMMKWSMNSNSQPSSYYPKTLRRCWWDKNQPQKSDLHVEGVKLREDSIKWNGDPKKRGLEICKRKHFSSLNHICNHFQSIYTRIYLLRLCRGQIYLDKSSPFLFNDLLKSILTVKSFL